MDKLFTSLGLMSGTSMDGIDASVIKSDGRRVFSIIYNKYFEYSKSLFRKLANLRDKVNNKEDLNYYLDEIKSVERDITNFHGKIAIMIINNISHKIDFIGFHGQTIYHNSKQKISKQLGDGYLLSQLTKKKVIFNFRENDLKNNGLGAPLVPIYHNLIANKNFEKDFKKKKFINFLNIGGIANITKTSYWNSDNDADLKIEAGDIGPGNCLIDEWIRNNSKKNFDENGYYASSGTSNRLILNQALENFEFNQPNKQSLDIKDFDVSFVRGLSLQDGAATLSDYTAEIIFRSMNFSSNKSTIWIVCGGGRKNKYLINSIKNKFFNSNKEVVVNPSENFGINGDFVESQAFAYIAIRSHLKLPISFPKTTKCTKPITGGVCVSNF